MKKENNTKPVLNRKEKKGGRGAKENEKSKNEKEGRRRASRQQEDEVAAARQQQDARQQQEVQQDSNKTTQDDTRPASRHQQHQANPLYVHTNIHTYLHEDSNNTRPILFFHIFSRVHDLVMICVDGAIWTLLLLSHTHPTHVSESCHTHIDICACYPRGPPDSHGTRVNPSFNTKIDMCAWHR